MNFIRVFIMMVFTILTINQASAEITNINSGTGVEGTNIQITGKGLHSAANPAKITVANEDNVVYGELEIVSAKPNKIIAKLPYVSALRYLILHVSGGGASGGETLAGPAAEIPVLVFNNPSVLNEQDGDPGQEATSSVSFTGPQGPQGATGASGATGDRGPVGVSGPSGPSGATILGVNNAFTGNNTFSGSSTLSGTNTLSGSTTLSGTTTISGRIQGTSPLILEGSAGNTNGTTLAITGPTGARTITVPDTNGTFLVRDITKSIGITGAGTAWAIYTTSGAYDVMNVNVDAVGRVVTTLTNGVAGHVLLMNFAFATDGVDEVTITDTDSGAANTIDLTGAATDLVINDDGDTLILMHNGTNWIEIGRSITP